MRERKRRQRRLSISGVMIFMVTAATLVSMFIGIMVFALVYKRSVTQNAMISSEQAASQVSNIVRNYLDNTQRTVEMLKGYYKEGEEKREEAIEALVSVSPDVVAVTSYDLQNRTMLHSWTGDHAVKENIYRNLSVEQWEEYTGEQMFISTPHVESLLQNYYPWVVSVYQKMKDKDGNEEMVVMDISFAQIAGYVDDVGIGSHGYCFIMDKEGNIVYHPQQQLIFSGLKEEETEKMKESRDGTFQWKDGIYSVKTRQNSGWRIVAVSFTSEMITDKVRNVVLITVALLIGVLTVTVAGSAVFSRLVGRPVQQLVKAMKEFEKKAEDFAYEPVHGSKEIEALSDSLEHMVKRIQALMSKVRNEEITLRKTELRALQAQINPHFLYNTLDSIGWLCEEERSQDAVEMVNALARLFRISISKGHELITVGKEVEHAKSYLKIQKFRYKEQFTYDFHIDEACLGYYCNKITLQPFIENAIYHGLDRMVDEGHIQIGISQTEDKIVFTVEDNGVGMTEEETKELLKKEPGDKTGIGIKNVNDRIKIYFGEAYGVEIESEPDEGTLVRITMPKLQEPVL